MNTFTKLQPKTVTVDVSMANYLANMLCMLFCYFPPRYISHWPPLAVSRPPINLIQQPPQQSFELPNTTRINQSGHRRVFQAVAHSHEASSHAEPDFLKWIHIFSFGLMFLYHILLLLINKLYDFKPDSCIDVISRHPGFFCYIGGSTSLDWWL